MCNYNEAPCCTQRDPGSAYVKLNGRIHHYMKNVNSTDPSCGLAWFIFDNVSSLAATASARNVNPAVFQQIHEGPKKVNSYCIDLYFGGLEAQVRAYGINIVPRMADQRQHFDVCSVVNDRQTGNMKIPVQAHNS